MEQIEISQQSDRKKLHNKLLNKLEVAPQLNRQIVSFQSTKAQPIYRWFKYKEGFSPNLVKLFLRKYSSKQGKILDPFAGTGTTLFASQEEGWDSYGIELLPVGAFVMEVRKALSSIELKEFEKAVKTIWESVEKSKSKKQYIQHISITKDAFPDITEDLLNKYLDSCYKIKNKEVSLLLRFAAFSVLEEISYTRKDGQYLRWDYRSKRKLSGKQFNKGTIQDFKQAVSSKLELMLRDIKNPDFIDMFSVIEEYPQKKDVQIALGSCLQELPKLSSESFDFTITSPPYCNRYDYTRTYALELVFLGLDNEKVKELRQAMLSCTVENKEKVEELSKLYSERGQEDVFEFIVSTYHKSKAMKEVNSILDGFKVEGKLNNNGIARMVRNYFLEMCFVIYEISRVTKSRGYCVMVNDNVKYGGEEIPVDLILSEFASMFDFSIEKILVLPKGKGNSSQQMGNFGRTEVRKCVYLWRKK